MTGDTAVAVGPAADDGELTRFQWDLLYLLAGTEGQTDYGLGLRDTLAAYYDEEVTHGRLYPNLDALVDAGLVAKSQRDRRTNEYTLTDAGAEVVAEDAAHRTALADHLRGERDA